jgi:hypothetical protein
MDILKRLRIECNALLKKAKQARKEAAQLLKHMKVIQDIEKGIEKWAECGQEKNARRRREQGYPGRRRQDGHRRGGPKFINSSLRSTSHRLRRLPSVTPFR